TAAAAHPGFVLCRLLYNDVTDHSRVLGAAILRAEKVIGPRFRCAEPQHCVPPREHVLLHTKCGNIETVDHVLRGHDQFYVATDGNVEFVDLTLSFGVLELAHPLLGDDVDFGGIARWRAALEENDRAPGEDDEENAERNNRPGKLQRCGTFDLFRHHTLAMAVTRSKINNSSEN